MGDPKKTKKKYIRPRKPWDKTRLDEEREIKKTYGLKNKKELWGIEAMLKNKRNNARKLLALELETRIQREKELTDSLKKIGLIKENASLDDVLGLKIQELLERRLQTIVWRKGLANTTKQARQFIVHGHIAINGKKITTPSYTVKTDEENKIGYYKKEMKITPPKQKKEAEKPLFSEKSRLPKTDAKEDAEKEGKDKTKKEAVKEKKTIKKTVKKETDTKEIPSKTEEKKEHKKEETEEKKPAKETRVEKIAETDAEKETKKESGTAEEGKTK
ncbi:MAG: 30S ribosomal protein S4 [archaeon]